MIVIGNGVALVPGFDMPLRTRLVRFFFSLFSWLLVCHSLLGTSVTMMLSLLKHFARFLRRPNVHAIERTEDEYREIDRHKYFLSEKAGYDVGWDHAAADWDANHASHFRQAAEPEEIRSTGISMLFRRLFSRPAGS